LLADAGYGMSAPFRQELTARKLALQLPFPRISESMGNHDSKIVDADSVD
jgi:hypothetical protein